VEGDKPHLKIREQQAYN